MKGLTQTINFDRKELTLKGVKSLEVFLGIVLLGMGSTLGIFAGLGQTTAISTSSALSGAFNITVGTAMYLEYVVFIGLQWLVLKKQFRFICVLQLLPSLVKTSVLDFFRYDFTPFQLLNPDTYMDKLIIFAIGMVFNSLGFTATKCSEFVNYPPESFCAVVSDKTGFRFGSCKTALDFIYVALTIAICLLSGQGLGIVREGTIFFALVNGTLINLFTPYMRKFYRKLEDVLGL
jgi:uncharacterized membrane protein YczE